MQKKRPKKGGSGKKIPLIKNPKQLESAVIVISAIVIGLAVILYSLFIYRNIEIIPDPKLNPAFYSNTNELFNMKLINFNKGTL